MVATRRVDKRVAQSLAAPVATIIGERGFRFCTPLRVAQHGGKCGTDGFAVPRVVHTFSGYEAVLARIAAALREIPPTASRPAQAVCDAGSEHRRNV